MQVSYKKVKLYPGILFHIFLIGAIYSFWITYAQKPGYSQYSFFQLLLYGLVYIALVYINMLYFFPRFFLKGQILKYIFLTLACFAIGSLLMQWILYPDWYCFSSYVVTSQMYIDSSVQLMKYASFSGLGITYILFTRWQDSEKKVTTLKHINLNTELENLKKQISPHFLFNTLNNLYVLIKTEPKTAAETTLHLSDLLRYHLYESSNKMVPLTQELDCVRGLLYIEQLRKKDWVFNVDIPATITNNLYIAPLTIIVLVENAIKHGSQKLEKGSMEITIDIKDTYVIFTIANTMPVTGLQGKTASGIGLSNLQRRLSLLYPGQFSIYITVEPEKFSVTLKLPYEMHSDR